MLELVARPLGGFLREIYQHSFLTAVVGLMLYVCYRVVLRFFAPSPLSVAPRVPTYLPFGIDFVAWSVYHNSSHKDIILWRKLFSRYGRGIAPYTVEVQLGSERVIFTADHENMKAILATKFAEYGKGPKFYDDWKDFLGNSIFATDGRQWEDARHLIRPLFLRQRIEDLNVFEKHTTKLVTMLSGPYGEPCEVDVMNLFFRFTLDVATDFLFGAPLNSLENPEEEFAVAFAEVQRVQRLITVAGPLLPFVSKKSYHNSIRTVDNFIAQFITETLALPIDELEKLTRSDRNYTFLSALALHTHDPIQIRDQLVAVLLAGRDTTAATLSWVIHELSACPSKVSRLRSEILAHSSPNSIPSFAELKAMKYLQAVLNETLRLYPAIPFNMRIALENTCLPHGGGVDGLDPICVQKNTIIAYSPLIMQRRPDIYPAAYGDGTPFPSPDVFEPERWLHDSTTIPAHHPLQDGNTAEFSGKSEASPKATWSPPAWTYLPFNGGPRICLGQQFALTEMAYTLVRIFQRYERVERVHAAGEYGSLRSNIVLTPSHGLKVRFVESNKGT